MKNKIIILLLCLLLMTMLMACIRQESDSSHSSNNNIERTSVQMEQTDNSNLETEPSSASAVTKEELIKEEVRFQNLLDSLNADNFSKIQINYMGANADIQTYFSEDRIVIQQWVTLLQKIKTTANPYTATVGSGFSIYLFKDETSIYIGGFMLPYIYNSTTRTMNIIENYSELQEEFKNLFEKVIV